MMAIRRCERLGCAPRCVTADGAEHTGIDIFVSCALCGRRGPHIECEIFTPDLKEKVVVAWNDESSTNG